MAGILTIESAAKPGFGNMHVHTKQTEQNISNTFGLILHCFL